MVPNWFLFWWAFPAMLATLEVHGVSTCGPTVGSLDA